MKQKISRDKETRSGGRSKVQWMIDASYCTGTLTLRGFCGSSDVEGGSKKVVWNINGDRRQRPFDWPGWACVDCCRRFVATRQY